MIIIYGIYICYCTSSIIYAQSKPLNAKEPYTVCHVLQNLTLYDGKIIQIRGEWRGRHIEEQCQTPLQTDSHKWPNAILLIYPNNLHEEYGDKPVNWTFGPNEAETSFRELMRFNGPVHATIIGRLDARAKLLPSPNGGPPVPFGYGHLNAFPAQIVMKEIKDIVGSEPRQADEKIVIEGLDDF
jgi:hypothetical protein